MGASESPEPMHERCILARNVQRPDSRLGNSMTQTPSRIHRASLPGWTFVVSSIGSVAAATIAVVAGPTACVLVVLGALLAYVTVALPGVLFALYMLSGTYKAVIQPYSPVDITAALALLNALQAAPVILHHRPRNISRAGVAMLVFVAFLYLGGVLYAPDQNLSLGFATTYWALAFLPVLPAVARIGSDPRYVRQFLWAFFALGIPMVVAGLAQLSSSVRLVAFGASTIEVGRAVLLVPLIGATFVLQQHRKIPSAVAIVLIPAAVVVAVATGSRGPLLALFVLGVVGAIRYLTRPGSLNWRVAGAVAGLSIASIVALLSLATDLPGLSVNRLGVFESFVGGAVTGNADTSVLDNSAGRRVILFGLAASMFEERPVLGFGTGGFAALSPRFLTPPYDEWPHNALLQFAAEFGVVGVAAFAGLVILALKRPFPRGHLGGAVRVALMFFLLNSMVSDDIYGDRTTWGLWALVFLIDVPRVARSAGRWSIAPAPTLHRGPINPSQMPEGRGPITSERKSSPAVG